MFSAVYDAVRIAERESQSASATAPTVIARARRVRAFTTRRVVSKQLHRFAEAIAPAGAVAETGFTANQPTSC